MTNSTGGRNCRRSRPSARSAGPRPRATLRGLLKSKSWLTRAAAAQALGATNDRSDENAKALKALLEDSNVLVKAEARLSLKALGRAVPE